MTTVKLEICDWWKDKWEEHKIWQIYLIDFIWIGKERQ